MPAKFIPNPNAKIPVTCPGCGHESEQLFFELERARQFVCAGCGQTVTITGDAFEAISKAIKDGLNKF